MTPGTLGAASRRGPRRSSGGIVARDVAVGDIDDSSGQGAYAHDGSRRQHLVLQEMSWRTGPLF
jgi:hypothetical protein